MCHVRLDKMSGGERAAQTELTGQNASGHDPSETASIVTWVGGMGAFDSEEVEHCILRFENGATTNGADLDRWHRNADLKIAVIAILC